MTNLFAAKKPLLNKAFAALRKQGFIAKQNFWCCGSCGGSDAHRIAIEDNAKGYVFYHKQDRDGAKETGSLFIRFGSANATDSIQADKDVGTELVAALKEAGLDVEWSGDPQTAVLIR